MNLQRNNSSRQFKIVLKNYPPIQMKFLPRVLQNRQLAHKKECGMFLVSFFVLICSSCLSVIDSCSISSHDSLQNEITISAN